ncbi:hypothetical protein Tco_0015815 [Tanacetum coccineum]
MAQQIFLAAQLVPKFQDIRRCNNYVVLQTVYLQQFWKTVSKVPDTKDTIKFKLDTQEIIYTVEMLCDTLHLPVETPSNPFIAPYPCFTKRIIADLMKKYPSISPRLEEDYHSIKYDISFMSVYTMGNVTVRGMLISDAFLTDEICATDDYKETTPRAHKTPTLNAASPQGKKRKQSDEKTSSPSKSLKVTIKQKHVVEGEQDDESYASKFVASMLNDDDDDSGNRLEPGSHKENPKVIHDDDDDADNKAEKKDEKKDDEMGSLEIRTKKMMWRRKGYMIKNMERKCVTIDEFWKVHQKVDQVLHKIVPQLAERATNDLIESNLKPMVADTIIQDRDAFQSQVLALISNEFDAQAPNIIEELFKNYVQNNVIQDVLKHKFEKSSTSNTSCKNDDFHLQHHDEHQDDDAPPEGEKRVKRHMIFKRSKSAKGSSSKQSAKESTAYAPKQQQDWDGWVEETIIDEDEVIPKDETPELIIEFQNVDKHVLTIFDHLRIEATLNDMLSNQFRNAEEYTYHVEQVTNFMENQIRVYKQNQRKVRDNPEEYFSNHRITEVVRITIDQQYGLDFMEQIIMMRENDKPYSFSEADFKYLNKDDIEDLYYLCQNKKVNYHETKLMNSLITFIRSRVIWERVHDFQFGIESYQINVNLTAPTLTFPGIEVHDPYSIVDKPNTGLIYLNNKNEKRVMYLVEIVKFCDATLEKVLEEVKLKIFQSEPWKKPPQVGELDRGIMKAYEREITKRLRHREKMRRWESFMNGRLIMPTMTRLKKSTLRGRLLGSRKVFIIK